MFVGDDPARDGAAERAGLAIHLLSAERDRASRVGYGPPWLRRFALWRSSDLPSTRTARWRLRPDGPPSW